MGILGGILCFDKAGLCHRPPPNFADSPPATLPVRPGIVTFHRVMWPSALSQVRTFSANWRVASIFV